MKLCVICILALTLSAVWWTSACVVDLESYIDGENGIFVDTEPSWLYHGTGLKDFNGDGYGDMVFGYGTSGQDTFPVHVVYGGADLPNHVHVSEDTIDGTNGFTIYGDPGSDFGGGAADAGDVNGDGYSDLLITARSAGKAYVLFGAPVMPAKIILSTYVNGSNGFIVETFPSSAQGIGDVNADGVEDIMLSQGGEAYVIFGKRTPFNTTVDVHALHGRDGFLIVNSLYPTGRIGISVTGGSDFNGDGVSDMVVAGACTYEEGGYAAIIFGGNTEVPEVVDIATLSQRSGLMFKLTGQSLYLAVSSLNDFNGDGVGDIALARSYEGGDLGHVYVLFGSRDVPPSPLEVEDLNGSNGFAILGDQMGNFGYMVSPHGGDLNGDGLTDILVTNDFNYSYQSSGVHSFVFRGTTQRFDSEVTCTALIAADLAIQTESFCGYYCDVRSVYPCDINGDGFDDMLNYGYRKPILYGSEQFC
eukprot:CAMPEP_0119118946 /NCGR_PEP_ID=MMETSP1310-20130426/648_1 /TAXON_ID=464262 /ORGANISM="Genus nov. species nov., Strain RCC2339" /LENGTH=473 /DNA_ID=CAMNT_0007108349 /DNA_START=97 /DNA_END=1518 /DNA_ORIENTATION=+